MTAGIGMVWVRLRHLSLLDTSMCAHSDNRHGEEGGDAAQRQSSLMSFIASHFWLKTVIIHFRHL